MWRRFLRDLIVELYWLKKILIRRWQLDTPIGFVGILALLSGFTLFIVMGEGLAKLFQEMIPWVSGSKVGSVYWFSIGLALKASFIFLIFCSSIIIFFLMNLFYRR